MDDDGLKVLDLKRQSVRGAIRDSVDAEALPEPALPWITDLGAPEPSEKASNPLKFTKCGRRSGRLHVAGGHAYVLASRCRRG
jgi:hypothetical protein